jgi:hypothetical protein
MCGRISRTSPREAIAEEFGVSRFVNVDLRPRYNEEKRWAALISALVGSPANHSPTGSIRMSEPFPLSLSPTPPAQDGGARQ